MRHKFILWWACRKRPFFAATQMIEVKADKLKDAESIAWNTKPDAPLLHNDYCCYIQKLECPISEWDLIL